MYAIYIINKKMTNSEISTPVSYSKFPFPNGQFGRP